MCCNNGSWADGIVEWMIDWRDRRMSGCTALEQRRGQCIRRVCSNGLCAVRRNSCAISSLVMFVVSNWWLR